MPGPVNEEQTVTLISSTSISEDGEITPGILPIPAHLGQVLRKKMMKIQL